MELQVSGLAGGRAGRPVKCNQGPRVPGTQPAGRRALAFFAGAVIAGALFAWRETRARQPLLPLRLFRSVPLAAGTVLVMMLMFALFGAMFFMTFFLENVHGLSAVATGVRLLPLTGMLIVSARCPA
jgi:hypothetical protein